MSPCQGESREFESRLPLHGVGTSVASLVPIFYKNRNNGSRRCSSLSPQTTALSAGAPICLNKACLCSDAFFFCVKKYNHTKNIIKIITNPLTNLDICDKLIYCPILRYCALGGTIRGEKDKRNSCYILHLPTFYGRCGNGEQFYPRCRQGAFYARQAGMLTVARHKTDNEIIYLMR